MVLKVVVLKVAVVEYDCYWEWEFDRVGCSPCRWLYCLQRRMLLERGVEEEASDIYVKQEIPFSINLVSNLLDDIRCNLVGQSETIGGQTHLCPELEVIKLDDITSCLTVLRNYITTWSRDVTKNSHTIQEEMRQAKVRLADVEMQLQATMSESEGVETSLLNQLQVGGVRRSVCALFILPCCSSVCTCTMCCLGYTRRSPGMLGADPGAD